MTKNTAKGLFQVRLSASGEILKNGRNEINVYISSDKGQKIENAKVELVPWMPEHGHGAAWPPAVFDQGNGVYRAVVALTMPGHWQLTVKISKGDSEDSVLFDFPDVKN